LSVGEGTGSINSEESCANFFRLLQVFKGESSIPSPLDQAKSFPSLVEGGLEDVAYKEVEAAMGALPRKVGSLIASLLSLIKGMGWSSANL